MAQDRGEVWVFAEQRKGKILEIGLELLGKGRELAGTLGTQLVAVLMGDGVEPETSRLIAHGADKVYLVEDRALNDYRNDVFAGVICDLVSAHRPEIFLFGATAVGKDLAPTVAGRLETGLTAHCVRLEIDPEGRLVQSVPAYGGLAQIVCPERRPQMATAGSGVMRKLAPDPARRGEVVKVTPRVTAGDGAIRLVDEVTRESRGAAQLESARVVVAGGMGIGSAAGWRLVEELAATLGGAVGATRPPVDEGWATEDVMIGQSGKTVRPDLYIGIGISGEMQHTVGIRDAKVTVAINRDPKAQIFQFVDFGIVGEYQEVLPVLLRRIRARKEAQPA